MRLPSDIRYPFISNYIIVLTTEKTYKDPCCDNSRADEAPRELKPSPRNEFFSTWGASIFSFVMLVLGLVGEYFFHISQFSDLPGLAWYAIAYLPVGFPVLVKGWKSILKGDVFTEFFLMGIATLGAFAIGEYPEAVAVMLFYTIGESLQHKAVSRARKNIQALLDMRPDLAHVHRKGNVIPVSPEAVAVGETIEVKAGERVPLDGIMVTEHGSFNPAAITGESRPITRRNEGEVLAGMINLDSLVLLKVIRPFQESSLSKIFKAIQEAASRKAKPEQFIRKFARIYTPIVTFMAIGLALLPYFWVDDYQFREWLYRALVFLVISCPCALVISIPLGYFGGIGAASRNGILFKGSNYLDLITKVNTVVMDKTGTLTKGVFEVQKVHASDTAHADWLVLAASLESKSSHPIAKAITSSVKKTNKPVFSPEKLEEVSGKGLTGLVEGHKVVVGNTALMRDNGIRPESEADHESSTVIHVAVDEKYCGHIIIADETKQDTRQAIGDLRKTGIKSIFLFSGDRDAVTQALVKELKLDKGYGDLLPEQKVARLEALKRAKDKTVAFVGDGINDGPVLASADVGIAMGGMGSDLAIETADVVIQTDQPSKICGHAHWESH
jgi:Cd2+/Zn2+-exporting ATPase